ncbi:MAG: DnaJ domain-containing protein [Chloroflexota bacterium]
MKDYYQILGLPENASQEDIKGAFRKLAFEYHPDTCPGDKTQAEEKFKEINEAFGVLGDEAKRQQYDFARKGLGTNIPYGNFQYSQQDIFRDIFANRVMVDELNQMFQQAGLRFDQDFLHHVFFESTGVVFQFFTGPGGVNHRVYRFGGSETPIPTSQSTGELTGMPAYRPSWIARMLNKATIKVGMFALHHLFGLSLEAPPQNNHNHQIKLELSPAEAARGAEKDIKFKDNGKTRKFRVKVPAGVKTGTKIRLKNVSIDKKPGDVYLDVKIKS